MSGDAELRALQRKVEQGAYDSVAAWIQRRLRYGDLEPRHVTLAGAFGFEPARLVLDTSAGYNFLRRPDRRGAFHIAHEVLGDQRILQYAHTVVEAGLISIEPITNKVIVGARKRAMKMCSETPLTPVGEEILTAVGGAIDRTQDKIYSIEEADQQVEEAIIWRARGSIYTALYNLLMAPTFQPLAYRFLVDDIVESVAEGMSYKAAYDKGGNVDEGPFFVAFGSLLGEFVVGLR